MAQVSYAMMPKPVFQTLGCMMVYQTVMTMRMRQPAFKKFMSMANVTMVSCHVESIVQHCYSISDHCVYDTDHRGALTPCQNRLAPHGL